MIIEVLSQKYNTKSNAGIGIIKEPNILKRLNSIIEWPRCTFPSTIEVPTKINPPTLDDAGNIVAGTEEVEVSLYLEDREFLGKKPELKPSNTFLFRGQVLAVKSEDELVNVISETTQYGELALERFLEDYIKPEEELRKKSSLSQVKMEELTEIPDNFSSYVNLPYSYHSAWKEMTEGSEKIWKCTVFPITLIFDDWKVRYDSDFFEETDEEYIKEEAMRMMAWIAQNKPNQTVHAPKTFDQVKQDYITIYGRQLKAHYEMAKEMKEGN